jgi:hypothetical protein
MISGRKEAFLFSFFFMQVLKREIVPLQLHRGRGLEAQNGKPEASARASPSARR